MRRTIVALLAVLVLSLSACADSGSSSSGSSNGSSSNGSSSNGSSGSSNGSSSNGSSGSSNGSSSNGSSGSSNGSSDGGSSGGSSGTTGTTTPSNPAPSAPATSAPPESPPENFTLPEPDSDGGVKVPDAPPKELRNQSPKSRLSSLPPVPRGCLDDDLTLLDLFAPYVSVPLRLTYCLLYVGTIARLPNEIDIRIEAPSFEGPTINVPLLAPDRSQRPLATVALILLIIAVAVTFGYVLGRRQRD